MLVAQERKRILQKLSVDSTFSEKGMIPNFCLGRLVVVVVVVQLQIGEEIEIRGPGGKIYFDPDRDPKKYNHIVCIAGGIG